jgi:hypothetical protein
MRSYDDKTFRNVNTNSLKECFLVRDGLYNHPCVSVCILYSVFCVASVFRIVNETSTEANRLLISCTVQTAGQVHYKSTVYRGWNKKPYNCSKQSVYSPVPRKCMRVPNSCLDSLPIVHTELNFTVYLVCPTEI